MLMDKTLMDKTLMDKILIDKKLGNKEPNSNSFIHPLKNPLRTMPHKKG
jgi:hypothetical protein